MLPGGELSPPTLGGDPKLAPPVSGLTAGIMTPHNNIVSGSSPENGLLLQGKLGLTQPFFQGMQPLRDNPQVLAPKFSVKSDVLFDEVQAGRQGTVWKSFCGPLPLDQLEFALTSSGKSPVRLHPQHVDGAEDYSTVVVSAPPFHIGRPRRRFTVIVGEPPSTGGGMTGRYRDCRLYLGVTEVAVSRSSSGVASPARLARFCGPTLLQLPLDKMAPFTIAVSNIHHQPPSTTTFFLLVGSTHESINAACLWRTHLQ